MKQKIMFVATTPFAVNAFLAGHLAALSAHYDVTLCVNTRAYELVSSLRQHVSVVDVGFVRKIAPIRDLWVLYRLIRAIRRVRPVAIHSITPKAGMLSMIAGKLCGVAYRWHTFTGQVWANKQGAARRLFKFFDRLIVACASRVFADSPSQCRLLEAEGIVPAGGISILGHGSIAGVDLARFRPDPAARDRLRRQLGCADATWVFLFVGRMVLDKGIPDLIAAFADVAGRRPDVELWLVGPDEEGLQEALRDMVGSCVYPVRWLGKTMQPELYMAAADILVLPSYREGFGSVIIEAAASGIPCIAYRIDGVIDAVQDGQTGCLVAVGQVLALAATMERLINDRSELKRLGAQAKHKAEADFSSHSVTAAWLDFYTRTLSMAEKA